MHKAIVPLLFIFLVSPPLVGGAQEEEPLPGGEPTVPGEYSVPEEPALR